jgi:hypothetical protein
MTGGSQASQDSAATAAAGRNAMRFTVDGWDPAYGTSLELEDYLEESTAVVDVNVELPADQWQAIDPDTDCPAPEALLFVDGVRRIEARVWIDENSDIHGQPTEASAALCASYAAGVVCCHGQQAHLVLANIRRGLFTVASHASDIITWAGNYGARHVAGKAPGTPLMVRLSQALQRHLAEVEVVTAVQARAAVYEHGVPADGDLLVVDGPLRGRQHLPRALGYIKSHRSTYLPPELNALVAELVPGQRTPVFLMGTSWDRHSWYLRLPGPLGSPWAGVVRIECSADLPVSAVIRLAAVSQKCLGRFASAAYKDARAPQNLYPIAGLERELRRRLGDPRLLYRALRVAAQAHVRCPDPDPAVESQVKPNLAWTSKTASTVGDSPSRSGRITLDISAPR